MIYPKDRSKKCRFVVNVRGKSVPFRGNQMCYSEVRVKHPRWSMKIASMVCEDTFEAR